MFDIKCFITWNDKAITWRNTWLSENAVTCNIHTNRCKYMYYMLYCLSTYTVTCCYILLYFITCLLHAALHAAMIHYMLHYMLL